METILTRFDEYAARKRAAAIAADIPGFETVFQHLPRGHELVTVGNEWTRRLFDGGFLLSTTGRGEPALSVSLVFVQSREGNTEAANPSDLGGGETDKHLIYEGLSRVWADAVLSGSTTARSNTLVFSVWHPELVRLREERGLPRHPVQTVVTDRADLPLDTALLYTTPALRTIIIASSAGAAKLTPRLRERPWIRVIDAGQPLSLTAALQQLANEGIRTISAIGGRHTATALLRERLVSDLYLTTSPISAGTPGTPFYEGPPLTMERVIEKRGRGREAAVRFEHFVLSGPSSPGLPPSRP